jgi:sugar/nucleoside kinase (ribokinase family)
VSPTVSPAYAIVGGLALDNVITADGARLIGRSGGNTLWASLGAAIFDSSVGIVARAGEDYPQRALDLLAARGIATDGVRRVAGPHRLRIAYQHLADGRRLQPVPADVLAVIPAEERSAFVDSTINASDRRGGDPEPADIPEAWLTGVRGWHLPLVPLAAHRMLVAALATPGSRLIADCPNRHEIKDFVADLTPSVARLDVFLPSTSDLDIIAPDADPVEACELLLEATSTPIILKCGPAGVLVIGPDGLRRQVPSLAANVVDPTGAGDAFCGAFLVGLDQTDDLLEAAIFGAVSASFAVETDDALALAAVTPAQRDHRMRALRALMSQS